MTPASTLAALALLALPLAGAAWFAVGIVMALRDLAAREDADDTAFRTAFAELGGMDFRESPPSGARDGSSWADRRRRTPPAGGLVHPLRPASAPLSR